MFSEFKNPISNENNDYFNTTIIDIKVTSRQICFATSYHLLIFFFFFSIDETNLLFNLSFL